MCVRSFLLTLQIIAAVSWPISSGYATPCDGIWQKRLDVAAVLLQRPQAQASGFFNPGTDRVYEHMQAGSWHIIWVEGARSEPGALIIKVSGQAKWFNKGWGGVALPSEQDDLRQEMRDFAPDLPPALARCFVWYVTEGRYLPLSVTWKNPFNSEDSK